MPEVSDTPRDHNDYPRARLRSRVPRKVRRTAYPLLLQEMRNRLDKDNTMNRSSKETQRAIHILHGAECSIRTIVRKTGAAKNTIAKELKRPGSKMKFTCLSIYKCLKCGEKVDYNKEHSAAGEIICFDCHSCGWRSPQYLNLTTGKVEGGEGKKWFLADHLADHYRKPDTEMAAQKKTENYEKAPQNIPKNIPVDTDVKDNVQTPPNRQTTKATPPGGNMSYKPKRCSKGCATGAVKDGLCTSCYKKEHGGVSPYPKPTSDLGSKPPKEMKAELPDDAKKSVMAFKSISDQVKTLKGTNNAHPCFFCGEVHDAPKTGVGHIQFHDGEHEHRIYVCHYCSSRGLEDMLKLNPAAIIKTLGALMYDRALDSRSW